jgi:hypothetical protein
MASLSGQGGIVNSNTLAFVGRANQALEKWWQEFDDLHSMYVQSRLNNLTQLYRPNDGFGGVNAEDPRRRSTLC